MNDTNDKELKEAITIYRERYGNIEFDMFKLDDIIREMREKKSEK